MSAAAAAQGIPGPREIAREKEEAAVTAKTTAIVNGSAAGSEREPAVKSTTREAQGAVTAEQKNFMYSSWWKDEDKISIFSFTYFMWLAKYKGTKHPSPTGKVPHWPALNQTFFIWVRATPIVILQYISMKYFDFEWPLPLAIVAYVTAFFFYVKSTIYNINDMCEKYGFLDASKARDHCPDAKVTQLTLVVVGTIVFRVVIGCILKFDQTKLPTLSPWLPLEISWYLIAVDFMFYIYHRSCHEIDWLWKYHRTHHLTKHPTAVFTPFADLEQDFLEILVIPTVAALALNTNFHTWWFALCHLLHTEILGHSGMRAYAGGANPVQLLLRQLNMELVVEDHDLHHRSGWRKSFNYGKQTRIFDTLFGTGRPREESYLENVDWNAKVESPKTFL